MELRRRVCIIPFSLPKPSFIHLSHSLSRWACFQSEDMRDRFVKSCPPTSSSLCSVGSGINKIIWAGNVEILNKEFHHWTNGLQQPNASEEMVLFHLNDPTVLYDIGLPNFHYVIKENYFKRNGKCEILFVKSKHMCEHNDNWPIINLFLILALLLQSWMTFICLFIFARH